MTRIHDYLMSMAERCARRYVRRPEVRAVYVGGSLSRGRPNRYSDIDTIVMCDRVPEDEELREIAEHNGGEGWHVVSRGETGVLDRYYLDGVECEFAWGLVSWYEERLHNVLEEHSLEPVDQLIASGLLDSVVLYGKRLVGGMKRRLEAFPRELQVKMVSRHLIPCPIQELRHRILKPDSLVRFYGILNRIQRDLVSVLFGLNRMYHPGDYKKLDLLIRRMEAKPPDLFRRLGDMYAGTPEEALVDLDRMYGQVLELVEQHLPEVDTARTREMYGMALTPFALPDRPEA